MLLSNAVLFAEVRSYLCVLADTASGFAASLEYEWVLLHLDHLHGGQVTPISVVRTGDGTVLYDVARTAITRLVDYGVEPLRARDLSEHARHRLGRRAPAVTYGDVASRLRETMTWLLDRRRITQQLGGRGSLRVPVTISEADRMAMGEEIQRYRAAVPAYCVEAVRAVTPTADLEGKEGLRDPAVALSPLARAGRCSDPC